MNELPHLTSIFDHLKRGCHLGPDDEPEFSEQKGQITGPLKSIETQDKEFKGFAEEFERAALANLKKDIRTLETQLANAEGESREKARQKFDLYTDLVRQKEKTIARFDHLAITASL